IRRTCSRMTPGRVFDISLPPRSTGDAVLSSWREDRKGSTLFLRRGEYGFGRGEAVWGAPVMAKIKGGAVVSFGGGRALDLAYHWHERNSRRDKALASRQGSGTPRARTPGRHPAARTLNALRLRTHSPASHAAPSVFNWLGRCQSGTIGESCGLVESVLG